MVPCVRAQHQFHSNNIIKLYHSAALDRLHTTGHRTTKGHSD